MDLLQVAHARLTAALPGVCVLLPAQAREPHLYTAAVDGEGRPKAKAARGLLEYLAAHPQGYVQLQDLVGTFADDVKATSTLTVHALAPTSDVARTLADRAIRALHKRGERPTPFRVLSDVSLTTDAEYARATVFFLATRKLPSPFSSG